MHNLWIHISASKFNLKKFLGWLTSISMKVVISWKRWVQALGKEKQEVHLILFFKDSILKCCLLFIHLCVCLLLYHFIMLRLAYPWSSSNIEHLNHHKDSSFGAFITTSTFLPPHSQREWPLICSLFLKFCHFRNVI